MDQSLQEKFQTLLQRYQDGEFEMTEQQKMRFYGLQRQAVDGDCTMQAPNKQNIAASKKYEAWISFRGMPKAEAMKAFVVSMEKFEPKHTADSAAAAEMIGTSTAKVIKEGTLFKQRDVFKGWRSRHFVLDEQFLHYYENKSDPVPRKSMQVFECTVTAVRPTKVGDTEFFPFVISHPKSTKTYNLATTSKTDADSWIAAITDLSKKQAPPSAPPTVVRLLPRRPIIDEDDDEDKSITAPVNPETTLANIPPKYAGKIELAVETILKAVTVPEGWEQMYEKSGVKAYKKPGGVVCVRGEALLQFSMLDIWSAVINEENRKTLDSQLNSTKKLKSFSSHTYVEYLRYKQVWPTAVRDFCNIGHWRLLKDGTVVIVSFSEKFEDICPLEEGLVRAELIMGGYVFKPVSGGVMCHYVVQTDLRGTLPVSVVNLVSTSQPMILAKLRDVLIEDSKKNARPMIVTVRKPVTYQELLYAYDSARVEKSEAAAAVAEIAEDAAAAEASHQEEAPASKLPKPVEKARAALLAATDPEREKHKLTIGSLFVLFLPVSLYFAVPSQFRAVAFVAGLCYALEYVFRLHLGTPHRKVSTRDLGTVANGRMLVRFSVDLTKLLRYLELRREETGVEITITHLAVKGAAVALSEIPNIHGHVIGGDFYRARSRGVDIGVSMELFENETVVMKIVDAELKPVDYIADELKTRTKEMRESVDPAHSRKARLLGMLPLVVANIVRKLLTLIGGKFGISVPFLGVTGFLHGAATVITLPSKEGADNDVDLAIVPNMTDSATPITVTVGGVRLQPCYDNERRLTASHVLNVAISVDTTAGSLAEAKRFCARMQQLMSNPSLMDKVDRITAISKQDEKAAVAKAAHQAALYKKK